MADMDLPEIGNYMHCLYVLQSRQNSKLSNGEFPKTKHRENDF